MLKMPERVVVAEVGPRDGLQSFARWVSTEDKIAIVNLLSDAGLPVIEVTSFAHPKVVPMLTDAEQVLTRINRRPDTVSAGQDGLCEHPFQILLFLGRALRY